MAAEVILRLENVSRAYKEADRELVILKDANFTLRRGEMVALVAPSGAGKSTLLHTAGLLERPDAGDVFLDGRSCSALSEDERTAIRRNDVGFVYQFHHLLPEFSALENVMMPQMIRGLAQKAASVRAQQLLDYMKIGPALLIVHQSFPVVSSSVLLSRVPLPMRRSCCWPMSRLAISIRQHRLMYSVHLRHWFVSPDLPR